jgi:hypothetical protein
VVAADEEDLVVLQVEVAIEGASQELHGGGREAVGLREQGDGWVKFDFHRYDWRALRIIRSSSALSDCERVDN